MRRGYSIEQFLKPLEPHQEQIFVTNVLSIADVIEWVVPQLEKQCRLYITSYSISDEFARRLYVIKQKKNVHEILVILDRRAILKLLKLSLSIYNIFSKVYLTNNHSKIFLFETADFFVTIAASQNLNRGKRYEQYFLSTEQGVFQKLKASWMSISQKNSIVMDEAILQNARQELNYII